MMRMKKKVEFVTYILMTMLNIFKLFQIIVKEIKVLAQMKE